MTCKLTSIAERFNNFGLEAGDEMKIAQSIYIAPRNESDYLKTFSLLGADLASGMDLEDGDYKLPVIEGCEYELRIKEDNIPLSPGDIFTAQFIVIDSGGVSYISTDSKIKEKLRLSEDYTSIAEEIKALVKSYES